MKRTSDVTGPAPLKTKGEKSCKLHAGRNLLKTGLMCTGAAAAAGVSLPASAAVEPNGYTISR